MCLLGDRRRATSCQRPQGQWESPAVKQKPFTQDFAGYTSMALIHHHEQLAWLPHYSRQRFNPEHTKENSTTDFLGEKQSPPSPTRKQAKVTPNLLVKDFSGSFAEVAVKYYTIRTIQLPIFFPFYSTLNLFHWGQTCQRLLDGMCLDSLLQLRLYSLILWCRSVLPELPPWTALKHHAPTKTLKTGKN